MSDFLKRILFFLLMVITIGTSHAKTETGIQPKIVGGSPATQGDWPWIVVLSYSTFSASEFFCGGSLIDERWVLTAAHCMQEGGVVKSADSFAAFIGGSHLYNDPGQLGLIEEVIVHPGYDETSSDNDLALLRLKTPITNVETLPLIPLATMDVLAAGTSTTVIGWGSTIGYDPGTNHAVNYPSDLQQVSMPLIDNSVCNVNLGGSVTGNMICAGLEAGGVDSCQGDSGGPLMIQQAGQWYQAGIVSWGYGCASAGFYGVYTRAANYIGWIEDQIFDLGVTDLNFPPIVAGQTMRLPVEISNNTQGVITIQSKVLSSGADISIGIDQCSSLNAGQSCQLEIIYSPSAAGVLSDTLTINSDSSIYPVIQAVITGEALPEIPVINSIVGNPDPALVWGTGGGDSWEQSTVTGTEGDASVVSGQTLSNNQSSWLVAHVSLTAERTLYFDWKVSSEKYFDGVELLLDGEVIEGMSGEIKWRQNSITVPAGNHVIHWHYHKDVTLSDGDDSTWLDNVSWDTPSAMQVFGEAGTDLEYTPLSGASVATDHNLSIWSTSVFQPWEIVTSQYVVGGTSLGTPNIPDGETTVLRAVIPSGTKQILSFDLKVSTEPGADTVAFSINGVTQFTSSGEQDWRHYEYEVGPSTAELIWSYEKDGVGSFGADRIWVDNVKLSEIDQENATGGGITSIYSLFVVFFYAYMNRSRRKMRYL